MTTLKRSLATLAAVAVAGLAAAAPAGAQQPAGFVVDGPITVQQPNGIIAVLIGFTPPIGSNKGS